MFINIRPFMQGLFDEESSGAAVLRYWATYLP